MQTVSPWLLQTEQALTAADRSIIYKKHVAEYLYEVVDLHSACWLLIYWPKGGKTGFRLTYAPDDTLILKKTVAHNDRLELQMKAAMGLYKVTIHWPGSDHSVLRFTTSLEPSAALVLPFWPRDIAPLGPGQVHVKQVGARSGQLYFSREGPGRCILPAKFDCIGRLQSGNPNLSRRYSGRRVAGDWFRATAVYRKQAFRAG